ncbi:mannitol/fructose-specific phosphotransferase system, IIA domain protein [Desulfosporosinus acidiphilus SJ4]|uniref:Mannitol-specific phosphotransferase enzyme IIA component n=1 Tax=Desulfosporosinus acidiphilus (strain DSM 22704 / JCM 16185 / SJ4) TaxID=646529 RepID=I4D2H7_DESAJ|nr:PTS sugar transporter subunit IIA [Desulfosporosinus acidiphilus]AFM40001.1 mannitol/fructose-specific phosphotransferase system, IIA domain protein [Desulfosporosinus acidiphilus SJ4]
MNQEIFNENNIILNLASESKREAILRAGELLKKNGYVQHDYLEGMEKREESLTTYVGNGVAIPHGLPEYIQYIVKSGLVMLQYPEGVDFGEGNTAYVVIGIAGKDDEHLELLSTIALVCQEEENVTKLKVASSKQEVLEILAGGDD